MNRFRKFFNQLRRSYNSPLWQIIFYVFCYETQNMNIFFYGISYARSLNLNCNLGSVKKHRFMNLRKRSGSKRCFVKLFKKAVKRLF